MSATRDKSQKFAFVYSNMYKIYEKGQPTPEPIAVQKQPVQLDPAQSLRDNLRALNSLHARLRAMLEELENLVKD